MVELVKGSTADFAIVGGDFNIDPRMTNETTYQTLTAELKNAMHEFFYYIEVLQLSRLRTRIVYEMVIFLSPTNFNQYCYFPLSDMNEPYSKALKRGFLPRGGIHKDNFDKSLRLLSAV